ncbi:FixH family protein [Magnetospira sp. QH-2]|uniref:FixH family protein n=1 Tax=Magnetospira sp. (strain QH-2) TaxID=1288970 RepID=UPI0003E81802|nr:FixH family protein [Magnetospira sp. QH-2]CCQ72125.1 nitrogen fixation protein fixH [Magnetospira sp. QH-2]
MAAQRADGWWYPWIFVVGMTIVVVVNGFLIYFATSTYSGLETENHYEEGIAYNQTLEMVRQQEAMGWTAEINFTPSGESAEGVNGTLLVKLLDRDGSPVPGLKVKAYFIRPTKEGFDREADMLPFSGGSYATPVSLPLKGQWDAHVVALGGEVPFQQVERFVAK